MFSFDLSDELKIKIKKLIKKDRKKVEIINKKIKEIINCDESSIKHYKNLRHDLKEYKRVHIDKHFVLTLKVDLQNNFILFADFETISLSFILLSTAITTPSAQTIPMLDGPSLVVLVAYST